MTETLEKDTNVKFYQFGSEQKKAAKFNEALKDVIEKDVDLLDQNLANLLKNINKKILKYNVNIKLTGSIRKIDDLIYQTEDEISKLIIEKGNIKVWLFSSRKKEKKERIKELDNVIEYLSDCQNDFNSLKKECEKLKKRKVKEKLLEGDIKKELKEEDPLERTINFYMKKQEKND